MIIWKVPSLLQNSHLQSVFFPWPFALHFLFPPRLSFTAPSILSPPRPDSPELGGDIYDRQVSAPASTSVNKNRLYPRWDQVWSNYSDLTRFPHPNFGSLAGEMGPLISGFSSLVNYYNLARINWENCSIFFGNRKKGLQIAWVMEFVGLVWRS